MKKRILTVVVIFTLTTALTGCVKGKQSITEAPTPFQMLLNDGSTFVYTFQDAETGVWYISSEQGVTPRLNLDGTLYKSE